MTTRKQNIIGIVVSAVLAVAFIPNAVGSEYSVEIFGLSYHSDRQTDYNERNYGLGLIRHLDNEHDAGWLGHERQVSMGAYKNSYYRMGGFIAYATHLKKIPLAGGTLRLGVEASLITGYRIKPVMPTAFPRMSFTVGRVSLIIRSMPGYVSSATMQYRF